MGMSQWSLRYSKIFNKFRECTNQNSLIFDFYSLTIEFPAEIALDQLFQQSDSGLHQVLHVNCGIQFLKNPENVDFDGQAGKRYFLQSKLAQSSSHIFSILFIVFNVSIKSEQSVSGEAWVSDSEMVCEKDSCLVLANNFVHC